MGCSAITAFSMTTIMSLPAGHEDEIPLPGGGESLGEGSIFNINKKACRSPLAPGSEWGYLSPNSDAY